jgi:hypothetical protein
MTLPIRFHGSCAHFPRAIVSDFFGRYIIAGDRAANDSWPDGFYRKVHHRSTGIVSD